MELRHLEGFVAIAEELHFGRAAARLHLAQPALSQQIRAFERELGVRLFDRNTRSVTLTEHGRALLDPARRTLTEAELARRAAIAGTAEIVGKVRIGFAGLSASEAIPALTRAVHRRHPGIELVLEGQSYAGAVVRRVADGRLDIGFSQRPVSVPGLSSRVYEREPLVAALPADHPLAERERVSVADLASEGFITFPGASGSVMRDALVVTTMNAGFSPRIVQEAPDTHTLMRLVAAGVGVAIAVASITLDIPGLVLRPFIETLPLHEAVIVWREEHLTRAGAAVRDLAAEVIPEPPAAPATE